MVVPARVLKFDKSDVIALQKLGGAVVLQWGDIPEATQRLIVDQALGVGGLPEMTGLSETIEGLVRKNEKTD